MLALAVRSAALSALIGDSVKCRAVATVEAPSVRWVATSPVIGSVVARRLCSRIAPGRARWAVRSRTGIALGPPDSKGPPLARRASDAVGQAWSGGDHHLPANLDVAT